MRKLTILLTAVAGVSLSLFFVVRYALNNNPSQEEANSGNVKYNRIKKEYRIKEMINYLNGVKIPFGASKTLEPAGNRMIQYQKLNSVHRTQKAAEDDVEWILRGPSNVAGRVRGLIVDPDDPTHQTWFAGTATGGMWKTTNGGDDWTCLTESLPYQATTTLAMALTNTNIIYMGTGESFTGSLNTSGGGVFKSTNKGEDWTFLALPDDPEDFRFTNRIIVSPFGEDTVLVATNAGVFKSTDGGSSWVKKYESEAGVEDLIADTSDFKTMYAGVNGVGVIRSVDAGENWELVKDGFSPSFYRIELAMSHINPQKIYASVELPDDQSTVYSSWDGGDTWEHIIDPTPDKRYDILGGQGFYDNTIDVHPYDENTFFAGGVNLWKITTTNTVEDGDSTVTIFDEIGTDLFLDFIPFTGNIIDGMNTGENEDATYLNDTDFCSIEIRFGPGIGQKAHRFYVPEEATSGVEAADYFYQDYIDVPFEVWDVTNNRQLMCSFRDQERDSVFNLYERSGSEGYGELGREYIYINAVEYDPDNPNDSIAKDGGRAYKNIFFFWPSLAEDGVWEPDNLPESKIFVKWDAPKERISNIAIVADSYGRFDGGNNYNVPDNGTTMEGLHPDHHELLVLPINESTGEFWIVNSNDGGLGLSKDNGVTFTQKYHNMITTQFYGVAKMPIYNEYIGGTQDNGTWQSAPGVHASLEIDYNAKIGGDGFETIWNQQDSTRIIGSVYNNQFMASYNGGISWANAAKGINSNESPFISRLSAVPSNNNILFAVCESGVYKSISFGVTDWELISIGEGWLGDGYTSYWSQVEVSAANEQLVWAGAAMNPDENMSLFLSTDQGESFEAVNTPAEPVPAFFTGIVPHPTDENTVYTLYGLYGYPKILRSTDQGDTWEDITEFTDGESANGFPDVACWSLFIFPDNTNRMWAGTDIGIVESTDNGATWHKLASNMRAVPVWQMFLQDNQVVAATYGSGIMTYQYGEPLWPNAIETTDSEIEFSVYPNPASDYLNVKLTELSGSDDLFLSIYSIQGKQVYSTMLNNDLLNQPASIDIRDLQAGSYIVNLTSGNTVYSQQIVIQ